MVIVEINCAQIVDDETFHDVFAKAFGFPDGYGRNMDAWVDCMSRLDEDFNYVRVESNGTATLVLENARDLNDRRPDLFNAIIEMSAGVNFRCFEASAPGLLAVAY